MRASTQENAPRSRREARELAAAASRPRHRSQHPRSQGRHTERPAVPTASLAPQTRREAKEWAARAARSSPPRLRTRIAAPTVAAAVVSACTATSLVGLPAKVAEGSLDPGTAHEAGGGSRSQAALPSYWQLANTADTADTRSTRGGSRGGADRAAMAWSVAAAEGRRTLASRVDAVQTSLTAGMDMTDRGRGQIREIAAAHAFHEPVLEASQTSGFGWRWGRMHQGLDFGADVGVLLYAVGQGAVTTTGWNPGLGYHVKITLDTGEVVVYGHLSKITASTGDRVEAGTTVGEVGSSGRSTGAHLHFEVHGDEGPINPLPWLEDRRD